jgi:hypothetical protein
MAAIDNLDFLNLNSLRNYPLKEGVSRISSNGLFTIPNDFIVDAQFAVSNDVIKQLYISKIANFVTTITLEISDDSSALVGLFTIDTSVHTQNKVYVMVPSASYAGGNAQLVIDTLDSINKCPSGIFSFTLATTEFETRTVIPSLNGISRLIFTNASGNSFTLTGDINIKARTNLKFKLDSGNTVILDAGENIGLNTICANTHNCIKTINGIGGDVDDDFTLAFSDCAVLNPIPSGTGLLLEDVCCKPCVGCSDISTLTTRLITAEDSLVTLRQYYTDLQVLFQEFKTTVTYSCNCPPGS